METKHHNSLGSWEETYMRYLHKRQLQPKLTSIPPGKRAMHCCHVHSWQSPHDSCLHAAETKPTLVSPGIIRFFHIFPPLLPGVGFWVSLTVFPGSIFQCHFLVKLPAMGTEMKKKKKRKKMKSEKRREKKKKGNIIMCNYCKCSMLEKDNSWWMKIYIISRVVMSFCSQSQEVSCLSPLTRTFPSNFCRFRRSLLKPLHACTKYQYTTPSCGLHLFT